MSTDLATNGAYVGRLDPYAGGIADEAPRVDALAVISCGTRAAGSDGRPGLPRASRPDDAQQIHIHDPQGHAPGLAEALAASGGKSLLISFPLDDQRQFIIQRFTRYSASRLEVYGDEASLTVIEKQGADNVHRRVNAGTPEYDKLVRTCKADTRIFFCLAEWVGEEAEIVFPDGLGVYAIRTTSRHSVRSIQGSLAYTAKFTHGRIAGLPFLLEVTYREVAGPDGSKRTIPVWTITTKPPEGIRLSNRTFRALATSALREGELLMLPAPSAPDLDDFSASGPVEVDDVSDADLARMAQGGLCDYEHYVKAWHATARGTPFDSDAARAAFLGMYTEDAYTSLSAFLRNASAIQADRLISALGDAVATAKDDSRSAVKYDDIYPSEEARDTAADIPMVTNGEHPMYVGYQKLAKVAEQFSVEYEMPTLPIEEAALDRLGKELKDRVKAAKRDAAVPA